MYHYVRDLPRTRFPRIHGMSTREFRSQLEYFKRHYTLISPSDLRLAMQGQILPPRSLLLTFDDGFADHYTDVFPLLDDSRICGLFFPPTACIEEGRVLDVNKIHFVLASQPNTAGLLRHVMDAIRDAPPELGLKSPEQYRAEIDCSSRWDKPEVMLFKRLLQRELPESFRFQVIDDLFRSHVSADEQAFAHELYMTPAQVRTMIRHGQEFGNHGYNHVWMNRLTPGELEWELNQGLSFLTRMGMKPTEDGWFMNFPYGGFNVQMLQWLRESNCLAGFSTRVGIADISVECPYHLPRLNCNDFPTVADAAVSPWTDRVRERQHERRNSSGWDGPCQCPPLSCKDCSLSKA
jgi:peptidoglycan/xylan/chitin deacetylase (PgdA/CDA1 family)